MIRLFVIDVLTQHDARSARVFARKTRTDFRDSWVVQDWMKLVAVLVLAALCLSMLYVVASYAIVKGQSFVIRWLVVFSATVVLDVGLRQTIETVVIFYTIPDLVASQVESVEAGLRRQAQALVMQEECKPKGSFSCPDYLFVSSALARERTDLVESQIILRFQGTTPDEICVINDKSALEAARFEASILASSKTGLPSDSSEVSVNRRRWRWLRRLRHCFSGATAAAVLTSLLLHIGSLSTDLQRIIISFVLPMIIGGVMFVFDALFNSGFILTVSFFVGVTVLATSCAIYRKNARLRAVVATVTAAAGATTPSMRQKTRLSSRNSTRNSGAGSQSRLSRRKTSGRSEVQSTTTSSHVETGEAQSKSAVARKTGGSVRGTKQSEAAAAFTADRLVAVEEDRNTDQSASSRKEASSFGDEASSSEYETDSSSSEYETDSSSSGEEASSSGEEASSSEDAPVHETQWRSGEAVSDSDSSSEDETQSEESSDAEIESSFGSQVNATKGASRQQAVLVQQRGSSLHQGDRTHATLATAGSIEDSASDKSDISDESDANIDFIDGTRGCASDSSSERSIEYVDVW